MPLYVKDAEVDRLVAQLAEKSERSKTEVVRLALFREWERTHDRPSLVEQGLAFAEALRQRSGAGAAADKAFIDSLYEK